MASSIRVFGFHRNGASRAGEIAAPALIASASEPRRSRRSTLLRIILRHRLTTVGLTIIALLCLMAIPQPSLASYRPHSQDLYAMLSSPSQSHRLGADNVGRDLLLRVIDGARVSLLVGILSTAASSVIGVVAGLVAGFKGGLVDIIMRATDAFLCFPPLIFILVMAAVLGPGPTTSLSRRISAAWSGVRLLSRMPRRVARPPALPRGRGRS